MLSLFLPSFLLLSERESIALELRGGGKVRSLWRLSLSLQLAAFFRKGCTPARMKERLESGEKYHRNGRDSEGGRQAGRHINTEGP